MNLPPSPPTKKHGLVSLHALFFALLFLLMCPSTSLADGHRNVHYYTGHGTVRWDLLTHLVYFDTTQIDGNGAFIPHTANEIQKIQELQRQAAQYGKVLMVGYGGGFAEVKGMLEDSNKRAAFIQALTNNVTSLNLAGIDIDYEYPYTAAEQALMDVFYTELRQSLGEAPLLTAAVYGYAVQLNPNTVNDSLDWIQTMSYHFRTASQSAGDLALWTNAGVAKGKINLGVPFSGKAYAGTSDVPWDICYNSFVDSVSPYNPDTNSVYYPRYNGTFHFVGVNLQKEKVRVAAAGGNGSMVWHHACDVWDPQRSLAVSLHDERVRHVAVIDSFELPVDLSANHLYAAGSAAIKGTHTRVSGFTGAEALLTFSGAQWSTSRLTSLKQPSGYSFPAGAQIRFDYKVLDAYPGVSFYLRLVDGAGNFIQQPSFNALGTTGWKRATFDRSEFSSNASFDENDIRSYMILAQIADPAAAFTSRVVFDNLVMIAPDPARRPIEDRDTDGISDRLENYLGTSPTDGNSTPASQYTGLHAWWKLDDNFSNLAREENQEVHGKVWGASWGAGVSGRALQFDGVDDKLVMDSSAALSGTTPFSLSVWVNTTDADGGMILQQRDSSTDGSQGQYRLRCTPTGTVNFSIHNNGYQFNFASVTAINDGKWHQVTAIRDGANGYIYIDGQLDAQASGPVKELNGLEVAAGCDHRDSIDYLEGTLDDIRIYSRAISGADISDTDNDQLDDHWEIAQLTDLTTGTSADQDTDGDGMSLFKEMVFGGSATHADVSTSFTASSIVDDNGSDKWEFRYRRAKNHAQLRISYQLQSSTSLQSGEWQDELSPPESIEDDPDGVSEWVVHQLPMPLDTAGKFYRCLTTGSSN